jgi:hypothetical protein
VTSDDDVYRTEVRFNAIYVLESLREGDFRSGQSLFDDIIVPQVSQKLGEGFITFARIANERELHRALREIEHAARVGNHHPIVHIEAHGIETGIELTDGARVEWSAITPRLAAINEACRMNLIVVAMACNGWNLTLSLMPSERAPVNMLVAPTSDMKAGVILDASKRFYEALVTHLDINEALLAANEGRDFDDWTIKPGTAEILFCRVYRMYVDGLTRDELHRRENQTVADVALARGLDVRQTAILREQVKRDLRDHPRNYDRMRKRFLMLDLFPQNAPKFGLTYEKCVPEDQRVTWAKRDR